jgi:hypothetical protein
VAGGQEHDSSLGTANIHSTARSVEGPSNGRLIFFLWSSSLIIISKPKVVAILCYEKQTPADNRDHTQPNDVILKVNSSFLCCDPLGGLTPPWGSPSRGVSGTRKWEAFLYRFVFRETPSLELVFECADFAAPTAYDMMNKRGINLMKSSG